MIANNKKFSKISILASIFLALYLFIFCSSVFAFDGKVEGGTMTPTATGVRIDGSGNVEFIGDFSTVAGFKVDLYAANALLRDSTGCATIANGI